MVRRRRSPEEARAEILAASRRLLADDGPQAIRLKRVGQEAGVSHSLVTHYFGTVDGLLEETFASFIRELRVEMLTRLQDSEDLEGIVGALFDALTHPLYARLAAWALLSGRVDTADFAPAREQGSRLVLDVVERRLEQSGLRPERDDLEQTYVAVLSTAFGYSLSRRLLWEGLGKEATEARDRVFRRRLVAMAKDSLGLSDEA
ncbi:MAG: TetR/AcrR family transcriptional regulator [Sandaracinaceae bacterium]